MRIFQYLRKESLVIKRTCKLKREIWLRLIPELNRLPAFLQDKCIQAYQGNTLIINNKIISHGVVSACNQCYVTLRGILYVPHGIFQLHIENKIVKEFLVREDTPWNLLILILYFDGELELFYITYIDHNVQRKVIFDKIRDFVWLDQTLHLIRGDNTLTVSNSQGFFKDLIFVEIRFRFILY